MTAKGSTPAACFPITKRRAAENAQHAGPLFALRVILQGARSRVSVNRAPVVFDHRELFNTLAHNSADFNFVRRWARTVNVSARASVRSARSVARIISRSCRLRAVFFMGGAPLRVSCPLSAEKKKEGRQENRTG